MRTEAHSTKVQTDKTEQKQNALYADVADMLASKGAGGDGPSIEEIVARDARETREMTCCCDYVCRLFS